MRRRLPQELMTHSLRDNFRLGFISFAIHFAHGLRSSLVVALIILPALSTFTYITIYGANVPYWDQWELIPFFEKLYTDNLSLTELFSQHNEHRIFFPRLLMILLGHWTSYNTVAEMYFSWALLCILSILLFFTYIQTGKQTWLSLAKFIPVTWLLFSLRQSENLLWGFQVGWFLVALFTVIAAYCLEKSKYLDRYFFLAVISGVFSTFTLASGLLIWPVGLFQILSRDGILQNKLNSRYTRMVCIWVIIAVAITIFYFMDYTKPSHHPYLLYFISSPFDSLLYFFTTIGNPLGLGQWWTASAGLIFFVLYIYTMWFMVRQRSCVLPSMWFALMMFTIMSAASLVLGRSGFGVEQAMSSRYTTFSILGVVGLYLVMISIKHSRIQISLATGIVITLVMVGIASSTDRGIREGRRLKNERSSAVVHLGTYRIASDNNLMQLYPKPQVVRERAEILQKYGLSIFNKPRFNANQLTLVGRSTLFSIDMINGRIVSQQDGWITLRTDEETIKIAGWAVDERAETEAGGVFINVDGLLDIPVLYGLERKDVANHFKNKRYKFSGYLASFATSGLGKGLHTLSLKVITADETGYYQPEHRIILEIE